MRVIKLYDQTVARAHYLNETGVTLSLTPWSGDTDRIQGHSTDSARVLELADGVQVYEGQDGDIVFRLGETAYLGNELLDSHAPGRIIDARFGRLRDRRPDETAIDAASLIA